MTSTSFEATESFALAMDARDPLANYRDSFFFPKAKNGEDCIYLCGHSLGLQPKTVSKYIEQELEDWRELAVEGHFLARNPWMPYHRLPQVDKYLARTFLGARTAVHQASYGCAYRRGSISRHC